jgi:tetratricopeptide (TPR) repeat protein
VPRLPPPTSGLTPAPGFGGRSRGLAGKYTDKAVAEFTQAIADFTEAIGLDPNEADNFSWRARCYGLTGANDKARADWSTAIRLDPDNAHAYSNRSAYYIAVGEYDKAIADGTEAGRLGVAILLHSEEAARVIAHHTEAIRLDPKASQNYLLRANVHAGKGEHAKAMADYNKAIQLDPKVASYYVNRGHARYYHNQGTGRDDVVEYDKAFADFAEAIRLDPENAYFYFLRGDLYGEKGGYDKGRADLAEAIRLDPIHCGELQLYFREERWFCRGPNRPMKPNPNRIST